MFHRTIDLVKALPFLPNNVTKILMSHSPEIQAKEIAKILKNKNEINKYLYRHKYINEPIEENWIMFETFMGKSYADSPKYIYEYLAKNYL